MCFCAQQSLKEKGTLVAPCGPLVVRGKLIDSVRSVILDELFSRPNSSRLVDREGNDLGIDFEDYHWAWKFSKEKLCLI